MKIEIPDQLYKDFLAHIQKVYLSDNVSEHVQQLIIQYLKMRCHPGYETDNLTKCKTNNQLIHDINRATWGEGWDDHSLYQERFLCIDIDNFKHFLDIHGLTEGDEMLVEIANKLKVTYPRNSIYRFGGDEFVVILGNEGVQVPEVHDDINLKYSVVNIVISKNQKRNHHINREIIFHLDKGIVESTPTGSFITYENKIEKST